MLKLKNVCCTFNKNTPNEKCIFSNFSVHIKDGDFVTIIGGNGSGKSTMMNIISGTCNIDGGQIILDDKNITNQPEHIRARAIGRVFQDPMKGTAANMRIFENLALAKRRGKVRGLKWGAYKDETEEYSKALKEFDLGIHENLELKSGVLSGGQRQALTLLMATIQKPKLLLLDEHTSALDPKTAQKVLYQTQKIISENHLTSLMITHNMKDAIYYGNRLIMMNNGKIVLDVSGDDKKNLTQDGLLKKFEYQIP